VQIATTLANEHAFHAAAEEVAELEKAGLDFVWVAENSGFDSPSHMGYLAARTERVWSGAGIM
jgi:alkanesulfonate monooxygenase SsuD/methylene tetrahydromethanopterin reductase-like flavin-dependent oxidoreductase (luciferase family)